MLLISRNLYQSYIIIAEKEMLPARELYNAEYSILYLHHRILKLWVSLMDQRRDDKLKLNIKESYWQLVHLTSELSILGGNLPSASRTLDENTGRCSITLNAKTCKIWMLVHQIWTSVTKLAWLQLCILNFYSKVLSFVAYSGCKVTRSALLFESEPHCFELIYFQKVRISRGLDCLLI